MECYNKLGSSINLLESYPKMLSILDDAGEYIRSLKEDKALIINRAQSEEENMRIQLGILHFLLIDRQQTQFDFKDLVVISRDGLKHCSNHIYSIISENWIRINTDIKTNVLSILIDFLSFPMAESLFCAIFKRMTSGDLNQANLWLIENMLNLIEEHKDLMLKDRKLLPLIVYTYLRLIPTHYQMSYAVNTPSNNLARLCRKEITLVLDIARNNFDECFRYGGRDMMFMLQQVSNIPEFRTLLSEMCHNIGTLSNNFTNITEIFSIATSKNIIATAIPFDMELWILWTMRCVHHCSATPYKRYQDLFNKRFFLTPESQNLRPYLIRFIIRVFYPDNDMIASTLISRWATISWLLVQVSSPTVVANCKMALIFDWLFYDSNHESIMDIEPAILAIMHNLTKYSSVSVTLIDFVVKTANLYHPNLREKIVTGVRVGLSEALRVNVFRSLGPLFEVLRHHGDLQKQFAELIGDNSILPAVVSSPIPKSQENNLNINDVKEKNGAAKISITSLGKSSSELISKPTNNNNVKITTSPAITTLFEAPKPVIEVVASEKPANKDISYDDLKRKFMKYSLVFDYSVERINVPSILTQINSSIVPALESLFNAAEQCCTHVTKCKVKRERKLTKKSIKSMEDNDLSGASDDEHLQDMYEKMEKVVIAILEDDSFDDLGIAGKTAAILCEICYPFFEKKLFPDYPDEEKLKVSLASPVFVIFKDISNMDTQDNKRELLLLLLSEMQMRQPRVGYYLIYYLKIAKVDDPNLSIYRSLCNSLEKPNLKNSLYKDLELLSNDDSRLMVFLLPDLYSAFSNEMVGNPKFAHLIISTLDASEINLLGFEIQKKNLKMFDSNSALDILKASLDWGTIEQYFIWELFLSHNLHSKCLYGLIPYLDFKKHPEAILRFSNFLRQDRPCQELIRLLFNREVEKDDHFTATLLYFWSIDKNSKFINILHTILSLGSKDKKKMRHSQSSDDIAVDLLKVLGHLDFMRLNCKDISFLQDETIQSDLQQMLTSRTMSDDIKATFSELLAIIDDEVDDFSDEETTNDNKSARVLRNLDSRRYHSDRKSYDDSIHTSVRGPTKRQLFNGTDSTSTDDDDDDDSDQDNNIRRNQHNHHKNSKKRLIIAD